MAQAQTIAVVGAGLMGHGIAQVFAAHDHPVRIYDPAPAVLATVHTRIRANLRGLGQDEAIADRITVCASLREAVAPADVVVEAAIENLAAKRELFSAIEKLAPAGAILASNTSVIPITQIMMVLEHRGRGLGTHWWNPPFLVPLVEVISTEWTTPEVVARTLALHDAIGKMAVHVKKDVPGFVGNRLQHALWREAISLVEHGVCDATTVDLVVKASFGRRLAVLGPLENADLVGTDLTLAIHEIVLRDLEASPEPSPFLRHLVEHGRLGMKSGEGFFSWTPDQMAELRLQVARHLEAALLADADASHDKTDR